MRLGEEIAVLDGLEGAIPDYYNVGPQFDPTAGQNLTGGSAWDPRLPLSPSNAGLAGADLPPADADLMGAAAALERNKGYHRAIPSSYAAGAVFDPTSGANYKGGSNWTPDMPLTPPVSGLAAVPDLDLAQVYSKNMNRLKGIPNYYDVPSQFDITAGANLTGGSTWDPRLPLTPSNAGLAEAYDGHALEDIDKYYGSTLGVLPSAPGLRFDPTGGQYSGGSSWDPRLPLTPSNAGLAELSAIEPMDGIYDNVFKAKLYRSQVPVFSKVASRARLMKAKAKAMQALRKGDVRRADQYGRVLQKIRTMRRGILKPAVGRGALAHKAHWAKVAQRVGARPMTSPIVRAARAMSRPVTAAVAPVSRPVRAVSRPVTAAVAPVSRPVTITAAQRFAKMMGSRF